MQILKNMSEHYMMTVARALTVCRPCRFGAGFVLCLAVLSLLQGCRDPEQDDTDTPPATSAQTAKVYVLNEGLYAMNNSTLSCLDLKNDLLVPDVFRQVNGRGLGDTGNELQRYGGKLYICVSTSNTVEVLEAATARSLKQIALYDEAGVGRQPRRITFWENKAYVACFDGTVCRIDTTTLEVEAFCRVGRNPDGICAANGKLYVSNSGGLDYPRYDSTVSVVSVAGFEEIKRINVSINPYTILSDRQGDVYVCTRGNYEEVSAGDPMGYGFRRIDSRTDELVQRFDDLAVLNFTVQGDTAYLYNYDYNRKTSWIKVFDLRTETVLQEDFIQDGTVLRTPYGMGVDPFSGDVYIGDAANFIVTGRVYCFSRDGKLKFRRETGMNPQGFAFVGADE